MIEKGLTRPNFWVQAAPGCASLLILGDVMGTSCQAGERNPGVGRVGVNRFAVTTALPHHLRVRIIVLALAKRTSRRVIREASLRMSNLRTKGRENVGWGYTNQPFGGQC